MPEKEINILPIVYYPDKVLRQKSEPVPEITEEIKSLVRKMEITMFANHGIGLSAIQVGTPLRLFIIAPQINSQKATDPVITFINPEIIPSEETTRMEEGCLSLPGSSAYVTRPSKVKVKALDIKGEKFEVEYDSYMARCVLHEYDHLDGKLYLDCVKRMKREQIQRKVKRTRKYMKRLG